MNSGHPIPKSREALKNGDWFPYVVSKLAPLEWWSFSTSTEEITPEDFPSDWSYSLAKQNTWEFPRFCFAMFRPTPEADTALYAAVAAYQGDVIWLMHDGCIGAFPARPTFVSAIDVDVLRLRLEEVGRNPPHADPEFVKRALADIPKLCAYLETRLGLKDKTPIDFDPQWLTREGLASSRGQFEDFFEPGSWSVILARDPEKISKTGQVSSAEDRQLNMGIGMFQSSALFEELGSDWKRFESDGGSGPIMPEFPFMSRLNDITADATFQSNEVDRLLAESMLAQSAVRSPEAIRGLDKLIRIARWAQKLKLGIYFGGQ